MNHLPSRWFSWNIKPYWQMILMKYQALLSLKFHNICCLLHLWLVHWSTVSYKLKNLLNPPVTTAADDKTSFPIIEKNKVWYFMRIVCRRFSWKIMPYLLFLKKPQNWKLLSAANYRWGFKSKCKKFHKLEPYDCMITETFTKKCFNCYFSKKTNCKIYWITKIFSLINPYFQESDSPEAYPRHFIEYTL